jgi:hypothetical protein
MIDTQDERLAVDFETFHLPVKGFGFAATAYLVVG